VCVCVCVYLYRFRVHEVDEFTTMSTAPYPPPPPVPPGPYQQPLQPGPGVYYPQQPVPGPAAPPGYIISYYPSLQQQQPAINADPTSVVTVTQTPAATDKSYVPHFVLAVSSLVCAVVFGCGICVFAPLAIIFAGKSIINNFIMFTINHNHQFSCKLTDCLRKLV